MAAVKIAFVCQVVDERDPVQATTVNWLRTLASNSRVESVFVITLRLGVFHLPSNVVVHGIRGASRLHRLGDFYIKTVRAKRSGIDCFFIHQGGPYPALLLPFRWFARKPIFQWKAHPHVGFSMKFYARFCDTMVFTSTPHGFPLALPNVRVVGQGVDTERFCEKPVLRDRQLVTVGRIAPRKGLDRLIRVVALLNRRYDARFYLDIYGPTLAKDVKYHKSLERLVEELGMSDHIVFRGSVDQKELPDILNRYQLFLHYCDTALDRAVTEAMGCSLPVLSTNLCVADILPADLRLRLIVPRDDLGIQACKIYEILSMDEDERLTLGRSLRRLIVRDHSVDVLFERILDHIENRVV